MNFHRADPTPHYQSLRLVSEGNRWELGMSRYQYGMRMRMGYAGMPPGTIDFCMGLDGEIYSKILMAILERLEAIPESAPWEEIDAVFPWRGTRPDLSIHLRPLLEASINV
jgi:hypothetical protein